MADSSSSACGNCGHNRRRHVVDPGRNGALGDNCGLCDCRTFVPWDAPRCASRYRADFVVRCAKIAHHNGIHTQGVFSWTDAAAEESMRANDPTMGARDDQVAGDHYKRFKIQPWDIWQEYGLDAFTGTVVKYLLRAGHKGSRLEDLKKARHTLDRLIEIEEAKGGE